MIQSGFTGSRIELRRSCGRLCSPFSSIKSRIKEFLTLADTDCAAQDFGSFEGLGDEHFWVWCSREETEVTLTFLVRQLSPKLRKSG